MSSSTSLPPRLLGLVAAVIWIWIMIQSSAEAAPSTTVTSTGERIISCGADEYICNLARTLAQALSEVNSTAVTIILASNVTLTSAISIPGRRNVTIRGALNVDFVPQIEAFRTRLFIVESTAQLNLRNLRLENGLTGDTRGGGAILLRPSSKLLAEKVNFVNNYASAGDGGAILSESATVILNRCEFLRNRAQLGDGGCIAATQSQIVLSSTLFVDNNAFFSGGAIRTSQTRIMFTNSTFDGNLARSGGALSLSSTVSGLIHGSVFVNNEAAYGGAIDDNNNQLAIFGCEFHSNSAWDYSSQAIFVQRDLSYLEGELVLVNIRIVDQPPVNFVNTIAKAGQILRISPVFQCPPVNASDNRTSRHFLCLPPSPGGPVCTTRNSVLSSPHVTTDCTCATGGGNLPEVVLSVQNATAALGMISLQRFSPCSQVILSSLFPSTCQTTGGYAPDGTACVLPSNRGGFVGCLPVTADLPHVRDAVSPRDGNAGEDYWCPTVPKYSMVDETKRQWGFCGLECGYASFEVEDSTTPTVSPTVSSTLVPTLSPNEYEYEDDETEGHDRPRMVLAQYMGYFGSFIEVRFDCNTNCGKYCELSVPCTFYFQEAESSWTCRWRSRQNLIIFGSRAVYALSLNEKNGIRCFEDADNRRNQAKGSIGLGGFQFLAAPSVSLVAPTEISRCASKDLVLDGTSSRVFTVGGIGWLTWELRRVEPTLDLYQGEIQILKSRLDACSKAKRLYCATGALPYEGRYGFALTISNAFGAASTATIIVELESDDDGMPMTIRFAGGSIVQAQVPGDFDSLLFTRLEVNVKKKPPCAFPASAYLELEDDSSPGLPSSEFDDAPMRVTWRIVGPRDLLTPGANLDRAIVPTSDPFIVNFSPSTLSLSSKHVLPFDVTVRVTADIALPFSQSKMFSDLVVRMIETPLIVQIRNSNRTLLETEKNLTIIANVTSGGRFAQEHIEYQWTCQMTSAASAKPLPCSKLAAAYMNLSAPHLSSVFLAEVLPNTQYTLQVTAFGATTNRVATMTAIFTSSTDLSKENTKPSIVFLQDTQRSATSPRSLVPRLNRDATMRVVGACPFNQTLNWTLIEQGFKRDTTNVLQLVPRAVIAPPGVLATNARYTLRLVCADLRSDRIISDGQALFAINSEPRGGILTVTPTSGTVFGTSFVMRLSGWLEDDGDLPLTYSFDFVQQYSDTPRSLAPVSTWATWESPLPLRTIAVRGRAIDSLGAASDFVQVPVIVSLPLTSDSVFDWYLAANRRWRRDWEMKTRSSREVLGEILVSIQPLAQLQSIFVDKQKAKELIAVMAFAMMRLAIQSANRLVAMDESSEDSRLEILAFVSEELLRFLPSASSQAATDELLQAILNNSSISDFKLSLRGVRAAFETTLASLNLNNTLLAEDDQFGDVTSCEYLKSLRMNSSVATSIPVKIESSLKAEALAFAWSVLLCGDFNQTQGLRRRLDSASQQSQIALPLELLDTLNRISQAALTGSIPGEEPVAVSVAASQFKAWRLSKEKAFSLSIGNVEFMQPIATNDDSAQDVSDDVWIAQIDSKDLASLHCFGGQAWTRWGEVKVRGLTVSPSSSLLPPNGRVLRWNGTQVDLMVPNNSTHHSLVRIQAGCNWLQVQDGTPSFESITCDLERSNSTANVNENFFSGRFGCRCPKSQRRRRRLASPSVSISNVLYVSSQVISSVLLPFDDPIWSPTSRPPTGTRTPTRFGDTWQPTMSEAPSFAPSPIFSSDTSQAWISILIIICILLICLLIALVAVYLDRRDEIRMTKAGRIARVMNGIKHRRIQRNFFAKMRFAYQNNYSLVVDETKFVMPVGHQGPSPNANTRQLSFPMMTTKFSGEAYRLALYKRHGWLSPLFGPYSLNSPRVSRVVLLFALLCGNMGISSALLWMVPGYALGENIGLVAFISSISTFIMTFVLDVVVRLCLDKGRISTKLQPQRTQGKTKAPSILPPKAVGDQQAPEEITISSKQAHFNHRIKRGSETPPPVIPSIQRHQSQNALDESASQGSWNDPVLMSRSMTPNRFLVLGEEDSRPPSPANLLSKTRALMRRSPSPFRYETSWKAGSAWESPSSFIRRGASPSMATREIPTAPSVVQLHSPSKPVKQETKTTVKALPSRSLIVLRKVPLVLFGWLGAACTVAYQVNPFHTSDRLNLWIQAWIIALIMDFFIWQTMSALVRLWMKTKLVERQKRYLHSRHSQAEAGGGGPELHLRIGLRQRSLRRRKSSNTTQASSSAAGTPAAASSTAVTGSPLKQPQLPKSSFLPSTLAMENIAEEEVENDPAIESFRWQARPKTPADDDLLLQDGGSVESDGPARELIELIFGMNQAQEQLGEDDDMIEHFDVIEGGGDDQMDAISLADSSDTPPPPAVPTMRVTPTRPGVTPFSSSPQRPKLLFASAMGDDESDDGEHGAREYNVQMAHAPVPPAPSGENKLQNQETGSVANSDGANDSAFIDLVEARERIRLETIV